MQNTKIGWIGLGNMGVPMVKSLLRAGFNVSVYNRSAGKTNPVTAEGAKVVHSPVQLLQQSDILFLMVADDASITSLFTAENGILSASCKDKIIINMSTVSSAISQKMAGLVKEKGGAYLDAPVSGSVKQAETATLVMMVGGDENAFLSVKPVFDCLGKFSLRVGEHGAGNAAKLAINTLLALHAQGLAETISFANSQGIATHDLLMLLNESALANVFMKIKGEAILQQNFKAAFALKHIVKDLKLAQDAGLNSPLAQTVTQTFEQAEPQLANEDIIAIYKTLQQDNA